MSLLNASPLLAAAGGEYQISRSVRLRSSASAFFSRTPASAGNRTTWTWSGWVKRGVLSGSSTYTLFSSRVDANNSGRLYFENSDTLNYLDVIGGTITTRRTSAAVFRDPSAWYHVVCVYDTANATSADRCILYVNGVRQTIGTSVDPSLNYASGRVNTASAHSIGQSGTEYFDGYLTEVNFIDGQALTPSSFGETDAVTGVWKPKKYAGTYGTNGFYLNFSNPTAGAAGIGADSSGNGNNWTPNNISLTSGATYDSMLDVPTPWADGGNGRGNYAVMSPITGTTNLSNGNLYLTGAGAYRTGYGTMALPATGQWYWEGQYLQANNNLGFALAVINPQTPLNPPIGAGAIAFNSIGQWWVESGSTTSTGNPGWTGSTVVGMRYDASNGEFAYTVNGTTWSTIVTGISRFNDGRVWVPAAWCFATNDQLTLNFGQRPFAYTPPSGFKALHTGNLPEPAIANGGEYFNTVLYTGNATARSITGVGFAPDFVWIKSRAAARNHHLNDIVRGVGRPLYSNTTGSEDTGATDCLTAYGSDGFSLGVDALGRGVNVNSDSYVAWNWKANGAGVTNTAGSITSTVSANPTAGFSIVTYTGTGSNATVGHGLGVAPAMVIVKRRNSTGNWQVRHTSIAAANSIQLNLTNAAASATTVWNSTNPSSTVFSVGSSADVNASSATYVAYCFAEVPGYSRFGSYTGNGSTDGPFVFCGFRPAFVLIKETSLGTGNWQLLDSSRSPYNVAAARLNPSTSGAESSSDNLIDFTANGFKLRHNGSVVSVNGSGQTYIFAAFAENPFKNALAR